MRLLALSLFVVCVVSARADEKADEWKALKGTWTVEKVIFNGVDAKDMLGSVILTMEDGKYTVDFAGNAHKGSIELKLKEKPRQMDIDETEGPNKGTKTKAIYELNGDTLKVCYSLEGKDRPTTFESKEGSDTLFVVYKRKK
jgi:uncharacterized protein (TIGR03067 family)